MIASRSVDTDWWARGIAAAGLLLSLLALALEFVRHRQAKPAVTLRVNVKRRRFENELRCKLLNSGGSPVGVSGYGLESEDDEVHVMRLSRKLVGRDVPARGALPFVAHIKVTHEDSAEVPYVLRVSRRPARRYVRDP